MFNLLQLEPVAQHKSEEGPPSVVEDRWAEDARVSEGSHRQLIRDGYPRFTWAFHDGEEIGPRMLARIAKHTGLRPDDL